MAAEKYDFSKIGFDDFRRFASDSNMSPYEKIGFPNFYREGAEAEIFDDICSKLLPLNRSGCRVLDIGPGCSDLPRMLIEKCVANEHELHLVDSEEMLALLPDLPLIKKVAAKYPDCPAEIAEWTGRIDAILCYSVMHYLITEVALLKWFDISLSLLAPGGYLLFGDIPNISKRKRFFSSEAGIRFHREFMKTEDSPVVEFNRIEFDNIDDSILVSLLLRARGQGFDAYLLPQRPTLPMANRREDLLIVRP